MSGFPVTPGVVRCKLSSRWINILVCEYIPEYSSRVEKFWESLKKPLNVLDFVYTVLYIMDMKQTTTRENEMQVRPIDEMTTYEVRDLETGELLTSFSGSTHNWTDAEEVAVAIGGYVETVSPYGREV